MQADRPADGGRRLTTLDESRPFLHINIIYQYNETVSEKREDLRAKANIKLFEKDADKERISETGSTPP